jgi:hypothetical protein
MTRKTIAVSILVLLTAIAGIAGMRKGQKAQPKFRVSGEEVPLKNFGIPPTPFSLGPGDSIGFTRYDYGTNGSANHNVVNYGDGAISIGRMAAQQPGHPDRGTWFTHSSDNGATWLPMTKVETARRGWSNIGQMADAGGIEVTVSHIADEVNVDAARGAGVWSASFSGSSVAYWPKLGIGIGFSIHFIGACIGGGPANIDIFYTRSQDAGVTFDIVDQLIFTNGLSDADGYDLAAWGNNVAAVSAGGGGDVVLVTSADGGSSWTEQTIYDVPQDGELPTGEETFVPDGSVAAVYDASGNLHITWANYLAIGDASNNPELFLSIDAPIMHWSAATGITNVAYPVPDTNITQFAGGRDGNYASQPDIAYDANGSIYITYQAYIPEVDDSLNNYEHVFATRSDDGGATWISSVDVTPGSGFDASFSSLADLVDANLHLVYNCDALAGNALQGGHVEYNIAIMYLQTSATLTDVTPTTDAVPADFRLNQNYPNPFNPSTMIRYALPVGSFVSLEVFDIIGRKVATLVNGDQPAGSYVVRFDAGNLANGTYFYSLKARKTEGGQSGEFTETRKMMLLK